MDSSKFWTALSLALMISVPVIGIYLAVTVDDTDYVFTGENHRNSR